MLLKRKKDARDCGNDVVDRAACFVVGRGE